MRAGKRRPRLAAFRVLAAGMLLASTAIASAQTCSFQSTPGGIAFTPFDPSAPSTQTAFTSVTVKCVPASGGVTPLWTFSGANGSAPLRMKHSVQDAFIAYTVSANPVGSSGSNQQWRVTASVLGSDYQNAIPGTYQDTVTASITP